ncbi:MAG: NUDIX domain-containing protein [Planctomycetota bacterium]
MAQRPSDVIVVAAIIEQANGEVLIARPANAGSGPSCWEFPSGHVREGESPEAAMRRVAQERVGLTLALDVGQPPFAGVYHGDPVVFRYFLAGVVDGGAQAVDYAEVRWVTQAQLRQFDFDPTTQQIVEWYTN